MALNKLNQQLAVKKSITGTGENRVTELYKGMQRAEMVSGLARTYLPSTEDGDKLPPESKYVQMRVEEALQELQSITTGIVNINAVIDYTNCLAKGTIVVDGSVLAKDVPVTHLMFLEKRLGTLADFFAHIPTLNQDTAWTKDEGQGLYRSEVVQTIKTKKVEDYKIVVQATKEFPAQVVKVTTDVNAGIWSTTQYSGAIPYDRVKLLKKRVESLRNAVKVAREEANQAEIVVADTGTALMNYLFA